MRKMWQNRERVGKSKFGIARGALYQSEMLSPPERKHEKRENLPLPMIFVLPLHIADKQSLAKTPTEILIDVHIHIFANWVLCRSKIGQRNRKCVFCTTDNVRAPVKIVRKRSCENVTSECPRQERVNSKRE